MFYREADFMAAATKIITEGTDACVGIAIKYKGPHQSCLIQCLATTNDIKSLVGVLGSEAADADFTFPSGGTAGVIDVSDAAMNTAGAVVDFINSLTNYEAAIVGMRRADSVDAIFLEDTTGVQAKSPCQEISKGAPLYLDSDVAKFHGFCISNRQFGPRDGPVGPTGVYINDEGDAINILDYFTITLTGTGTTSLVVYKIKGKEEISSHALTIAAYSNGSVTATYAFNDSDTGLGKPIAAAAGERLLVRAASATTLTAVSLYAQGRCVLPTGQIPPG